MHTLALRDIGPEGRTYIVDDSSVWASPLAEFHMPCRIVRPLTAELFVLPQEDGCLLKGKISGEVALPCNRCAEDAMIVLEHVFEEFEEYPGVNAGDAISAEGDPAFMAAGSVIRLEGGAPVLDAAALLWEEFSLALPVKPLCSPDCKGVCPACGKNLNEGPCGCAQDEGDPRLAALRNLKMPS